MQSADQYGHLVHVGGASVVTEIEPSVEAKMPPWTEAEAQRLEQRRREHALLMRQPQPLLSAGAKQQQALRASAAEAKDRAARTFEQMDKYGAGELSKEEVCARASGCACDRLGAEQAALTSVRLSAIALEGLWCVVGVCTVVRVRVEAGVCCLHACIAVFRSHVVMCCGTLRHGCTLRTCCGGLCAAAHAVREGG